MHHHRRPLLACLVAAVLALGLTVAHAHGEVRTAGQEHDHEHAHDHDHEHEDQHEPGHDHEADHEHEHDAEHEHGDEHEHGELGGMRLLVASLDGPELLVLAAADGTVLGRFTVPSPGRVHQLPNPQLAAVVHRDANRVGFVHSGLTVVDHGDHMDLLEGPPYVLQTVNYGPLPAHVFARGNDIAVYLDGRGAMAWLDARLLGVSLDFVDVPGAGPDHGALAVVDGHLVGGGRAQAAVGVFDRRGERLVTFEGCPDLHGQAVRERTVAFGCSDGVLLVTAEAGGVFTAHKLANPPGGPEHARIGALAGHDRSPLLVGDYGPGIAWIDPATRTVTVQEMSASPAAMRFADDGARLFVLTLDGVLHALDATTGEVLGSVAVLEPWAQDAPRPGFTHLGDHAFVVDPARRAVWLLDLDRLGVEARFDLPFAPGSAAALAIPGAVAH